MNAMIQLPLLLPLLLCTRAQLPESVTQEGAYGQLQAVPDEPKPEMEVLVWRPDHADAHELANALIELSRANVGQSGFVRVHAVAVNDSIVVTASRENVAHALHLLEQLDQATPSSSASAQLVSREYTLRHVTISDAIAALEPLSRQIQEVGPSMQWLSTQNLSYVRSRGVVVAHDSAQRVDEIFALLERIDVPMPQILLRSYLIRGTQEAHDPRIPQGVVTGLRELVPYENFELVSFSMVRTDVAAKISIEDRSENAQYSMLLDPEAYDPDRQRLTLARCIYEIARQEGMVTVNRQFSTSASLTAGEYTVLGGVGADADFLVLHMALVD